MGARCTCSARGGSGAQATRGARTHGEYDGTSRSDTFLAALWDGQESGRLGGTAQVVRFHLRGAMSGQVERRHAAATLLGPDQENIVHHMPVARRDDPDIGDSRGRWLTAEDGIESSTEPPPQFAQMFRRHAAFNVDARKYASQIAAQPQDSAAAAQCPVWRIFRAADWLARTYQRRVARVLLITYALVALMGFTSSPTRMWPART